MLTIKEINKTAFFPLVNPPSQLIFVIQLDCALFSLIFSMVSAFVLCALGRNGESLLVHLKINENDVMTLQPFRASSSSSFSSSSFSSSSSPYSISSLCHLLFETGKIAKYRNAKCVDIQLKHCLYLTANLLFTSQ